MTAARTTTENDRDAQREAWARWDATAGPGERSGLEHRPEGLELPFADVPEDDAA